MPSLSMGAEWKTYQLMINQPTAKQFYSPDITTGAIIVSKLPFSKTVTETNNSHLQKLRPELLYRNFLF